MPSSLHSIRCELRFICVVARRAVQVDSPKDRRFSILNACLAFLLTVGRCSMILASRSRSVGLENNQCSNHAAAPNELSAFCRGRVLSAHVCLVGTSVFGGSMEPFQVSKIRMNGDDANGVRVILIYARFAPRYAVYQTVERVTIQFSDDPAKELEQREKMARLSPLRGEINGLVDDWRTDHRPSFKSTAQRYDRRVADALIVALEGDVESALQILQRIRDDVVAERKSYARFLYLAHAALTALVLCIFASLAAMDIPRDKVESGPFTFNTWLAIGGGTLGAFFSIARGISSRSIHTDLQMVDNIIDAVVRVVIGTIAAVVLQALLDAHLFSVHISNAVLGATETVVGGSKVLITPPLVLLVAAFVAGFSERLIPDLLSTATMAAPEKLQAAPAAARPTENERQKLPGESTSGKPAAAEASTLSAHQHSEDMVDGCDVDVATANVPPTPDDRLPAASGGVAKG